MYSPGIGIGIVPRMSVTSVSVVTATVATGIGVTSFTANWNAFSGAQYYLLDVSTSSSFTTFVYQDQVVLAPTTAYVVIGLTENTTYYYRVRASTDAYIDPDYLAFFNRVVAAGGFLTVAEQDATKQLVADLKANNLWTPMKAIYPMVGASAAACAQNLKSSSFTGTFTSGWTFTSTGARPNGTSAYMDTFLAPNGNLAQNDAHASIYSRNNITGANAIDLGCGYTGSNTDFYLGAGYSGIGMISNINGSGGTIGATNTNTLGFFLSQRVSSTSTLMYQNNTQVHSHTAISTTPSSLSINLGRNTTSEYSNRELAFVSFGSSFNTTQRTNFYTTVQKFNQSLNRQVGAQIVSDPDAQAYIDRVYTAGGSLTNTEATAVNQLTIDLKSNGTWSSMKAIYPMIGASAAACAQNLRSSSFTGTFTSGWTFASTGVTPNGTSAYMNTGLNASTNLSQNSTHMSYYSRTNNTLAQVEMGVTAANSTYLLFNYAGFGYSSINAVEGIRTSVANPTTGFLIGSRIISTEEKYYTNNVAQTRTSNSSGIANLNMFLGGYNLAGSLGPAPSNKQCAFASIGDGLTDTQASSFYTSVQKFNQTLDRQVGAQVVSDPDAQAYINRVYTAGGTLTNAEATAVNKLAIDMKAAGLWTSMKAVYPMIGSSAASCAQNLKSSSFTGTFTSTGWTFASTGVKGNGTSAYMNTGLTMTSAESIDFAYGGYIRTNVSNLYGVITGARSAGNEFNLAGKWTANNSYPYLDMGNGTSWIYGTSVVDAGFFQGSRSSVNNLSFRRNNASLGTNTVAITAQANTASFYIGTLNDAGTPFNVCFIPDEISFVYYSSALTNTNMDDFYTLVQTFNQTLGRSVGPQIVSDADAQAYVNRVYNAGGSLTNTEANAVNQLVLDMKTAGIWTSMKAVYPMVGSSAAACAQNLKSSSFTGTFSSGWTFDSTGATPNGTSAYMDTLYNANNSGQLNSAHLSAYLRTNNNLSNAIIGANDTNGRHYLGQGNGFAAINSSSEGNYNPSSYQGFHLIKREISTQTKQFYNGSLNTTSTITSSARPNLNFYISARNSNGTPQNFMNNQFAFASIGDGLTDAQATALYNATQIFQNTLGRAITP